MKHITHLVSLESADAFAALDAASRQKTPGRGEFPHLDGLVQTTRDKVTAVGCERDRVDTVLVSVGALETLHQVSCRRVPDTNALVERAGRNVVTVGRHGHSGNTILNAQGVHKLAVQNIPKAHSLVTTSGSDVAAVTSKVKGVDVLLMSGKDVLNRTSGNIPNLSEQEKKPKLADWQQTDNTNCNQLDGISYPNLLILGTSGQVLSIRTEANATDVKVTVLIYAFILQSRNILAGGNIEDLSRTVASGRNVLAIAAESHAADDAVMDKMVHQLDVQNSLHLRVENRIPVGTLPLLRRRQVVRVPVGETVSGTLPHESLTGRRRTRDLRRSSRIGISELVALLGSCGTWRACSSLSGTGGSGWWGRRTVT